jgi:hypothetical protein
MNDTMSKIQKLKEAQSIPQAKAFTLFLVLPY